MRIASLFFVILFALATRPGFEDGAPLLRAATFDGPLSACIAPTAAAWDRADAYMVPLRMTPPYTRLDQPPPGQTIHTLEVRALTAVDGVAIRIAWRDETANLSPTRMGETRSFPDAVAVQFPGGATESVLPALSMGSPEKPVNIWRWLAGEDEAEESVADGFGRLAVVEGETPVRSAGVRVDGGWAVTLSRPYKVEPTVRFRSADEGVSGRTERVRIEPGARLPSSFAVWNGASGERDGRKAVSIWYYLRLPDG